MYPQCCTSSHTPALDATLTPHQTSVSAADGDHYNKLQLVKSREQLTLGCPLPTDISTT